MNDVQCSDVPDIVQGIFTRGYMAACVDMGAVVKTCPASITAEQAHVIRTGIAALGSQADHRFMQLMNTPPAPHGCCTSQDASGG